MMGRIVFLNPFPKDEIGGGIKTTYRQAEMLLQMGFDAIVVQPEGAPGWFTTRIVPDRAIPSLTASDVLVFPEILHGGIGEIARAATSATKVVFCQNQYYMMLNGMTASGYADIGFTRVATTSAIAKGMLERVLSLQDVAIVPCAIDPTIFLSRQKSTGIALVTRKLPREAALINAIFTLKYPRLRSVPWHVIDTKSERQTADILGRATIFLSLSSFESLGLTPLEAMASGAVVVGFHGHGGLEYATADNGFWFPPDHLEDVADRLAATIEGLARHDPALARMREAGFATAARFSEDAARAALRAFYSPNG
jgi:glycosyltransferase involved in cell wall biosynthesis